MVDNDQFDWTIANMTIMGPEADHPFLKKARTEKSKEREPIKVALPEIKDVDKGYRKILLVGYNGDLMDVLEKVYQGTDVKKLEFVLANSTKEAIEKIKDEKFDYVFTAGLRRDPEEAKILDMLHRRGEAMDFVPSVLINGYDIGFVASQKGAKTFVYDGAVDVQRAELVGAMPANAPMRLESELRQCEEYCNGNFKASRGARREFIQALRAEKQKRRAQKKGIEQRVEEAKDRVYAFV